MDGRFIDGYALDVTYKPAIPIPSGPYNVQSPQARLDYPSTMTLPIAPHPRNMWSGPPGPNPFVAPPLPPIVPPQPPANLPMWHFASPPVVDISPQIPPSAAVMVTPSATPAPEPSPPPPYSPMPPIPEIDQPVFSGAIDTPVDTIPPKVPNDPCNLFIKNLDDEVVATQRDLEKLFSDFGTITSTFLATYAPKDPSTHPVSKGFGFVAFSNAQEAEAAKDSMNGTLIGRKKIFVSYAEKKEDRQVRLKSLFANIDRMAEEVRNEMATNFGLREEIKRDARDETVSRRGVLRELPNGSTAEIGKISEPPFGRPIPRMFPCLLFLIK
jgi:RNA recognition motif. (a.k.a. RRM, RBD, or RNP domain)